MTDETRSNAYGASSGIGDTEGARAADQALDDALVARTTRHDAWANRAAKATERKEHFAAFDAITDQVGGLAGEIGAWNLDDTANVLNEQRHVLQQIMARSLEARAASQEDRKTDTDAAGQVQQV